MFLPAACTGSFEYGMKQFEARGVEPNERVGRDWLSKHSRVLCDGGGLITNLTIERSNPCLEKMTFGQG
jgi:hypothetical protein